MQLYFLYRCYDDRLANKTIDEIREIYSKYQNPSCTPYQGNSTAIQFDAYSQNISTNCDRWIYELDHGYKSMSSEVIQNNLNLMERIKKGFLYCRPSPQLNWVCDSAWKSTIGQSMFFVGSVFGTQIFGGLADNIGRLPVLIFANVMALIGNGITVFSTTVPVFSFSRFVSGLAVDSNFLMMYILGKI